MHWTTINIRQRDAVLIIEPHGHLTLTYDDGRRLMPTVVPLLEQGHRRLLLNLKHLSHVDSTGVGEIVGLYTRVTRLGGQLHLCDVPARVQDILEATRLDAVLSSFGTEDEAVAAMSAAQ